jgi:hypothetical protein
MIHPSSLEDHSSTPPMRSSTSDLVKSTSKSVEKRYAVISIGILLMSSQRIPTPGGDVDPINQRTNLKAMSGRIREWFGRKQLGRKNPLCRSQAHRSSRYGKRR